MGQKRAFRSALMSSLVILGFVVVSCSRQSRGVLDVHGDLEALLHNRGSVSIPGLRGIGIDEKDLSSSALFERIKKEASLGRADSQFILGVAFYYGLKPVPKDKVKARSYFISSARQGHRRAQWSAGRMFQIGEGGKADYAWAHYWLEKAALQGGIEAWNALGELYANGRGVKRDREAAYRFWEKAFAGGSAIAAYNIGALYQEPTWCSCPKVVHHDVNKADAYFRLAVDRALEDEELKKWFEDHDYRCPK